MARAILRNSFATGAILGPSFRPDVVDLELPVLTSPITLGQKTASAIPYSFAAGSDNEGIVAYDRRVNGGAWVNIGLDIAGTVIGALTGLTENTEYFVEFAGRDAAGLRSDPPISFTASTYPLGANGQDILDTTGPVDGNTEGILYPFVLAGHEDAWYYFTMMTNPAVGVMDMEPNGRFVAEGPAQDYFIADVYRNDELLGQFIGYMYQNEKPRLMFFS